MMSTNINSSRSYTR